MNPEQIKKDFAIFRNRAAGGAGRPFVYLDSAASSQTPDAVVEAMTAYYQKYRANVHRGVYEASERATAAYESARADAARFIGAAGAQEIIFTRGTTEAINFLAIQLTRDLGPEDEVVLTEMEHHANLVPWQMASQRRKFVLRFIPALADGRLDPGAARRLIGNKTKIVSICHASNVLGTINPVREIADLAHAQGALVAVDAAQSVPHMPVRVADLGADFLAFGGHKMLGPTGIGVLWGRAALLETLDPLFYGGDMIREVTLEGATWNDVPWKFEAGTPPIAEAIGLGAAIQYLEKLGMEEVFRHERELAEYAADTLRGIPGVTLYGPRDPSDRVGVVAFNIEGIHPHDAASLLDRYGVAVRGGHHCAMPLMRRLGIKGAVRASFALYNTREDADHLAEAIRAAQKVFSRQ